MRKFFLFFQLLAFGVVSEAQPTYYNHAATTGGTVNIFPFNANPVPGKRVQFVIAAGEFNQPAPAPAGNNITTLWFWANTAGTATYTNLTIRMATVSTTTFITTGAWYAGPMTTVLAQNTAVMPAGANTWVGIPLTTPFPYDPTMNIIIEVFHCGYTGTGFSLRQLGYGAAPNFRRQYSDAASVCGATVLPTGGDLNLPGIGITTTSASCTPNTTANGTATINLLGTVVNISACNFAGDYSTINGAVNGQTLRFTSSVATDFITVRSGTPGGPIIASGTTPLVFANTFTGTVYAHWNTPGCGTQNTCRTTTVQCTNCGAPACTVTLTSAAGTNAQTACNGSAITPITYATTVATGATFSGLPPGVSGNWAGNIATISGTPTTNGVYNYTVTLVGCTAPTTATGSITVITGGAPMSVVANPGTTLCNGDPALLTVMEATGPPAPATVAVTGFLNNNANAVIAFNFRNNNATAVTITGIESICSTAGLKDVSALYKTTAINGLPGALNAANGWNLFGSAVITGIANTTTTTTQPFMTGLSLVVPPGATYGIVVQAVNQGTTTAAQRYSTIAAGVYTFSAAGCDIITGTNFGYGGVAIPGAPTFALRGFMGKINVLAGGTLVPITTGTFLWTPATGLSSTTINPVAASPMVTTTYNVTHNNGGCTRAASITLTINQRPTITSQPANATICSGLPATFTVTGTGTAVTYQWQVSVAAGPYVNLANVAPYSGVNTATLTINPVAIAMSGNRYRCVLSGTCPPAGTDNISNPATLTVSALPVITISPTGAICGGIAGINGTALTASGANTYVWSPVTGLYTNATATTPYTSTNLATVYAAPTAATKYVVTGTATGTGCSNTASVDVNYTPPAPTVVPASVTMCLGDAAVKLKSSSSQSFTASFASGAVNITIPDGPTIPPVPTSYPAVVSNITASGIPAGATVANIRVRFNVTHAYVSDLVIAIKAPNGQIINLCALANYANPAGANFVNTTFSSASATAITPPYTGTYKADLAGATFTALGFTWPGGPTGYVPTSTVWSSLYSTPNGVWSVGLYDAGAPDGGVLNNWSLDIDYIVGVPATPAVWTPIAGLFSDATALTPYVAGTEVDSVWTKPTPSGVYTYQATVKSLNPSGTIPLPAQASTFTGNVRGYWFTAPSSFTMSSVFVPADASPGNQHVAVVRFTGATPPPAFPGTTNAFTTLFLAQNNASGAPIPVNIPINAGDVIGILGDRGADINSYGPTGPAITTINGVPVTLTRMGMQFPLATTTPQAIWQEPAGAISRTFFSYGLPVPQCTSPARNIVVTVNQPLAVTTQPADQAICTDKVATFSVAATGSGPISYQWQVSTNGGGSYANITNGGVYSGATTVTLTITAPPVSMSGYIYRCNITGAAPCPTITSFFRILTVYPLPTIVISANPTKLLPGMRTILNSTVSPNAAATNGYVWLRDGAAVTNTSTGIISGVGTGSMTIDVDGMGSYQLRVTDVNGCTNVSNILAITDSVSGKCFIYPNPNSGKFQVRYYSALNNVLPRGIAVFDSKGDRVLTQSYTIGRPYDRMEVDLRKFGKGLYWVEIVDRNGDRITMCRVVIQ